MKLKEAQMLGVLALIAVGIILLCMWGGQDKAKAKAPATGSAQAQAGAQTATEPDLAQLYNDLLDKQPTPAASADHQDGAAGMTIGGATPAPAPAASESGSLSSLIESVKASQIPLSQPAPARPAAASAPAAPPATVTHVVQSGETLSSISKKYYGTPHDWKVILDANSSVVKDPRDLRPNMRLIIPAKESKTASAPATTRQPSLLSATTPSPGAAGARTAASPKVHTHVVVKGDTLFRIALKYYGDGSRYRDVLAANRNVLSKPQDLRPGMKLVIP